MRSDGMLGAMRWMAAVGVLSVLCAAGSAEAQAGEDADDDIARSLFNAGKTAFDAGRYELAFDSWLKAYNQSNRPQLLYNVGLAADRLRRDEEALGFYEAYLREVPDAENRVEVEGRIKALTAATAKPAGEPAPAAATPPPMFCPVASTIVSGRFRSQNYYVNFP